MPPVIKRGLLQKLSLRLMICNWHVYGISMCHDGFFGSYMCEKKSRMVSISSLERTNFQKGGPPSNGQLANPK